MITNDRLTSANRDQQRGRQSYTSDKRDFYLDPLRVAISRLSDAEFNKMQREDLLDVLRFAGLDCLATVNSAQFEFVNDTDLRRLAYIARFACQRAIHCACIEQGQASPFSTFVSVN